MTDKPAELRDMRRVLAPGGRLFVSVPGPTPRSFVILDEALSRHISPEISPFVNVMFSLHDPDELQDLVSDAEFRDVAIQADTRNLRLPEPKKFLWQYVHSTPLTNAVGPTDEDSRAALEREVVTGWQPFVEECGMVMSPRMVIVTARKKRYAGRRGKPNSGEEPHHSFEQDLDSPRSYSFSGIPVVKSS